MSRIAELERYIEAQTRPDTEGLMQSLSLGFLAMAPLFLAYELAVASVHDGPRNTSELLLFRVFRLFGERQDFARRVVLGLLMALAFARCVRQELGLVPRLARIVGEGAGLALAAGPLLIGTIHVLGLAAPAALGAGPGSPAPSLAVAGRVLGAGAYEELVFRVGAYSALQLVVRHIGHFLGIARAPGAILGEGVALVGSATMFAAFHLAPFVGWLGRGGETFEPDIFSYRLLAGMLLAIVFRWRGPGVAAWTHGLFNLALCLGAGPDVFL